MFWGPTTGKNCQKLPHLRHSGVAKRKWPGRGGVMLIEGHKRWVANHTALFNIFHATQCIALICSWGLKKVRFIPPPFKGLSIAPCRQIWNQQSHIFKFYHVTQLYYKRFFHFYRASGSKFCYGLRISNYPHESFLESSGKTATTTTCGEGCFEAQTSKLNDRTNWSYYLLYYNLLGNFSWWILIRFWMFVLIIYKTFGHSTLDVCFITYVGRHPRAAGLMMGFSVINYDW